MSGFEVASTLRDMNLRIPIIGVAFSAEDKERFRLCGVDAVTTKPLTKESLSVAVSELK